jgi:hypothetical protein
LLSANLLPTQQPDASTPARATAVRFEDGIRRSGQESGALIAPNGTVLVQRAGGTRHVQFLGAELRAATGGTGTHNHPSGTAPSLEDVLLGVSWQLHEVRVVTVDYRFIVNQFAGIFGPAVQAEYDFQIDQVKRALTLEVRSGQLNRRDFFPELVHRSWGRVSSKLGFAYWREPS